MKLQRENWFSNSKKILLGVLFLVSFCISNTSVFAQNPQNNVDFTKVIVDSDKSKIDKNKTYFYMEKYADGSGYYMEALYFDSSGNYLGHLASGDKEGNKKQNIYLFQRTSASGGGFLYTNGENDDVIFEIRTQIRNGVEYVIEETSRMNGNVNIDASVKYNIDANGNFTGSDVSVTKRDGEYSQDNGRCVFNEWGAVKNSEYYAGSSLWNCIEQVLYSVLSIMAWVLGFAVWIFTMVFDMTVLGMSAFINNIEAINVVWKVFRDFSNILFIFILLFLAISTILGLNEHGVKHTLSKLILVAVLINFSMFFAKVVIDSSNILAVSFYKKIQPNSNVADISNVFDGFSSNTREVDIEALVKRDGIAGAFMGSFKLQKIFNDADDNRETDATAFAARPDAGTVFIMGTITMFIVFCIFLAATIIFIKRLTTLTILVMTSSLAFAATLLHKTEHYAQEWWQKLLAEAFYAPVFVAVIWMAILVMTDPSFGGDYLKKQSEVGGWFNVSTVVNYIIVINFFIMALVAGEKMGASGASGAMKGFQWFKSNLGSRLVQAGFRRTAGAWAYKYLEGKASGRPHAFVTWATKAMSGQAGLKIGGKEIWGTRKLAEMVATGARGALKGMVDGKVGSGASFREQFGERQHAIAEHEYEIKDDIGKVGEYYTELVTSGKNDLDIRVGYEKAWEAKDAKNQADILAAMKANEDKLRKAGKDTEANKVKNARETLIGRLSPQEKDEMEKKSEGSLAFHRQQYEELLLGEKDGHGGYKAGSGVQHNTSYQAIFGENGLQSQSVNAERALKELRMQGKKAGDADYDNAKTHLDSLNQQIQSHTNTLNQDAKVQELRRYFSSLNTTQQAGLSIDQIRNPLVRDLVQGRMFAQMENSGKLSKEDYRAFGKVIDDQITRLETYTQAQSGKDGKDNPIPTIPARQNLLRMVNDHLKSLGQAEIQVINGDDADAEERAMEYYENEILGGDQVTASVGRNASRSYATNLGQDGEKLNGRAGKARADSLKGKRASRV